MLALRLFAFLHCTLSNVVGKEESCTLMIVPLLGNLNKIITQHLRDLYRVADR